MVVVCLDAGGDGGKGGKKVNPAKSVVPSPADVPNETPGIQVGGRGSVVAKLG